MKMKTFGLLIASSVLAMAPIASASAHGRDHGHGRGHDHHYSSRGNNNAGLYALGGFALGAMFTARRQQVTYYAPAPQPVYYAAPQPVYYAPQSVYVAPRPVNYRGYY